MAGHFVKIPPTPHVCDVPDQRLQQISVGSIWQCDDCDRYWRYGHTADSWGAVWHVLFWRNLFKR